MANTLEYLNVTQEKLFAVKLATVSEQQQKPAHLQKHHRRLWNAITIWETVNGMRALIHRQVVAGNISLYVSCITNPVQFTCRAPIVRNLCRCWVAVIGTRREAQRATPELRQSVRGTSMGRMSSLQDGGVRLLWGKLRSCRARMHADNAI